MAMSAACAVPVDDSKPTIAQSNVKTESALFILVTSSKYR
jgi:hypothetical protein